MRHDSDCVFCRRPADMYLMFYDHRECELMRGEILLMPVCDEDAHNVNEIATSDHFQCMGHVVEADVVATLFAIRLEEVNR